MIEINDATSILHSKNKGRASADRVNAYCFCVLMSILCIITVLIPADKNVEALENRALIKLPELSLRTALSGEFSSQFEGFITDRVGFRTGFISMSRKIESAYGVAMRDAPTVVFSSNQASWGGYAFEPENYDQANYAQTHGSSGSIIGAERETGPDGEGYAAYAASDNGLAGSNAGGQGGAGQGGVGQGGVGQGSAFGEGVEPVRAGPLLAFPDRLIELFGYSESACIRYAEVVSGYTVALEGAGTRGGVDALEGAGARGGVDASGADGTREGVETVGRRARVFSLIVPTAIEFIDDRYKTATDSEYTAISLVNANLDSVYPVDAYSYLSAHRNEYIYFRTDHHWTALGAYYAYLAFCDAAGFAPVTIDEYDSYELPGFWGYLYNVHPTSELRENPDTIIYYKQRTPVEVSAPLHVVYGNATYSIFIGGDNPIYEINTSVGNGRTCAVIKDSYGNAFIPWLAPHYEKIIVFDPRSFNGSVIETLAQHDDVDLIILNSAFSVGSGGFNGLINGIR